MHLVPHSRVRQATANNTFQLEGFSGDGTVAAKVEGFLATEIQHDK